MFHPNRGAHTLISTRNTMSFCVDDFPFDVILSHGPCDDGMTAAWIAYRRLPAEYRQQLAAEGGPYAVKDPARDFVVHTDPRPWATSVEGALALQQRGFPVVFAFTYPQPEIPRELIQNRRVLMLDLDAGDATEKLVDAAASVVHIDHHKTGEAIVARCRAAFPDKYTAVFTTAKTESAASLAWKYFNPSLPIPDLVQYVQIADTWNWAQLHSVDVRAAKEAMYVYEHLASLPGVEALFQSWSPNTTQSLVADGAAFKKHQDRTALANAKKSDVAYVRVASSTAAPDVIMTCLVVNASPGTGTFVGNMQKQIVAPAHELSGTKIDLCAVWSYCLSADKIAVSLRGPGPDVDLSHVAANIRGDGVKPGGGHAAAAGFTVIGIENLRTVFLTERPAE